MSGSAPLVLSCKVRGADGFPLRYLLRTEAGKPSPSPSPSPSRFLRIVSRRTYWVCPKDIADKVVDGLNFEIHLAKAPALSHLAVRGEGAYYMAIHAVDRNLIVFDWCLTAHGSPVHLVYDAVKQSLTMIPSSPWRLIPVQPELRHYIAPATSVLVACIPGTDSGSYALVKMAEVTIYNKPVEKKDVLYVWRSSSPSLGWDLRRAEFPPLFKKGDVPCSYATVLAFTCGGHAFWANLFRGIIYCSLDALLSAPTYHGDSKLIFKSIKLPVEHPDDLPDPISCAMEENSYMYRTIGRCGESSIKFVTIEGFVQLLDFDKCKLKVWSLSPDDNMTRWRTERVLCLGSLVTQPEFNKGSLPTDMVPMCPSLSVEEDDVVYFMLGEYKKCCSVHKGSKNRCNGYVPAAKNPRYHLRVDMRSGVLLASARLPEQISTSMSIARTSLLPCH